MRVFVTGASGWIGSAVVPELIAAGHQPVCIARSEKSAEKLRSAGVEVRRGSLDDLDSLRAGAQVADGVIQLAFKHDFSDFAGAGRTERAALETFGQVLAGSHRPLLFASGLLGLAPGRMVTEADASPAVGADAPRGGAEEIALRIAERGVRTVALRFAPTVHGQGDAGFITALVETARAKGASGYVGDGGNRWPAVHRLDVASMVALALEKAPAGSTVHGAAEQGITAREIAGAIGRDLGLPTVSVAPDDAEQHFGWIGAFFGMDAPASSAITREVLGWTPTHPTLLEDLDAGRYQQH